MNYNLDSNILHKKILTQEQCTNITSRVMSLKDFWLKHPVFDKTFTIGVPICSFRFLNYSTYKKLYTYYNNILTTYFSDMKSIISSFVKEIFIGYNVRYGDEHGNPGFHIMYSSDNYTKVIHRDQQHKTIFKNPSYNHNVTFSFTLCIDVPPDGAGLYEYNNNLSDDYMSKQIIPTKTILNELKPRIIQYTPGYVYFHSGNIPHSIIEFNNDIKPRITLQGHGILDKTTNSIYLYF